MKNELKKISTVLLSVVLVLSAGVVFAAERDRSAASKNIPPPTDGSMPDDAILSRMERAVDSEVLAQWKKANPAPFHLFGEDRRFAVRNNIIPSHWFAKGSRAAELFCGKARPGEFYPFQVCVVSDTKRDLFWKAMTDLKVSIITPEKCIVGEKGVKPIWVMVDIPKDAAGKTLRGKVEVSDVKTGEKRFIPFEIEVAGDVLADGGISDAWRLSRLKWLNSDIGREDTVVKPYTPVVVDRKTRTINILGRKIVLGEDGLPKQIVSYFNGSNSRITDKGKELLAKPVAFNDACGKGSSEFVFVKTTPASASWRATTSAGGVKRIVEGRIDFAGVCSYRIRHEGARSVDASFELSMPADAARFSEGFGLPGGFFKEGKTEQVWDKKLHRDAAWMGNVNGGIAVRFKGKNYIRPLVNAYYNWRKLVLPESWAANGGKMALTKTADLATVSACGFDAPAGAEWNFDIYITPFRTIDMKTHLSERYFHIGQRGRKFNAEGTKKQGASVVNLHHNTVFNPYINYPYNDDGGPILKKAVEDAHNAGLLLKVYYTTRELTQNMPEFFALKSLDGEVLMKRDESVPGWPCTNSKGPHEWLAKHVGTDIIPAWRENVRFPEAYEPRLDLAVITTPDTRWDNFYLEGLDYLVREYGIDGLYIDDTALTGEAMLRARRILDRDGKRRLVDNHSWNHASSLAGRTTSNLVFLELYPYFDLLWRGEGFSNTRSPDFWLVGRSGVVYGLPGEMLGRGNPFRGMLFGMTDRWGWGGKPQGLWKFMDNVDLGNAELIGWWDDENPVKVEGSSDVLASVWKGKTATVLVVANFSKEPRSAKISFDAAKLGFDGMKCSWKKPVIKDVQSAGPAPDFSKNFEIPGEGGVILVCRP